MSEEAAADVEITSPAETRPGQVLADARTNKCLSVAEVAQQLKLSTSQVEALEADAYDRLPGPVFVRGFVRNYARLLGLDGETLVAALHLKREPVSASAAVPHSYNIPFPEQRPVNWRGYAAGLLALIAAVGLFEIFFSTPQSVVVSPPSSRVLTAPAVVQPAAPMPATEAVISAPVTAPQSTEPVVTTPAVVAAEPVAAATARKGMADLHFIFERQSWVEVRDRNDRLLFSQMNPAGTEQRLQGQPPLRVVAGNARGVRLRYNDKPFDLAPHTQVEVARFTLE